MKQTQTGMPNIIQYGYLNASTLMYTNKKEHTLSKSLVCKVVRVHKQRKGETKS